MNKEEKIQQLYDEIAPQIPVLGKAVDQIIDSGVTKYPIIIVHKNLVELGVPLIIDADAQGWSFNISSLEDFYNKKIIESDKIDEFRQVYKPTEDFLCLFVLSDMGATFNFLPRKGKEA